MDKIIIIISDIYNKASFYDIIFAYQRFKNNVPVFQNINSTTIASISLYY